MTASLPAFPTALASRLDRAQPVLLEVAAPAGFGKTTLLREYFGERYGRALIPCAGVRDALDLARRLQPELEAVFEDGGRTVSERLDAALEALRGSETDLLIFEDAHALARQAGVRDFLARIIGARPAHMRMVLSTRASLQLRLTRYAAPHEILVLRASDLAFDRATIASLCASFISDERSLDRVFEITRGWPVAVLLLRRLASEGRLEALDRLNDRAFDELRAYVADEILGDLSDGLLQALFTIAALPSATAADVRDLAPNDSAAADALELTNESPFFETRDDGSLSMHPIVRTTLLQSQDERRTLLLRRVAALREEERSWERAAELWLEAGDERRAAAALARHPLLLDPTPSKRYRAVLARLGRASIFRYPSLSSVSALLRMYCQEAQSLLDESEALWRTALLSSEASAADRFYLFGYRSLLMAHTGALAAALETTQAFYREKVELPPIVAAQLEYLFGFLSARAGAIDEAEPRLLRALSSVGEFSVMSAMICVSLATVARVRGDRTEWQLLQRAAVHADVAEVPNLSALVAAEMLVSRWLAGDRDGMMTAARTLEDGVAAGAAAFAALLGSALAQPFRIEPADLPEYLVFARLIACARSRDLDERVRLAREAVAFAVRTSVPYLIALAQLALALQDDGRFDEYTHHAQHAAASVESDEFRTAIASVVARRTDHGMLEPFVAMLSPAQTSLEAPLEVLVSSCSVRVDGAAVDVGGRELELLVALALRREPTSRDVLAGMLWPDVSSDAARNTFAVCLHRLRAALVRKDAIVREGDGYRLHHEARVDAWEWDRLEAISRTPIALHAAHRAMLERAWQQIPREAPSAVERWEWFAPTQRRLALLRVQLAHRLAADAFDRREFAAALAYARDAAAIDPCDEAAREVVIRAHLALGDRSAAMREFREYRATLFAELQTQPSSSLTKLVYP